jgi:hypothetical protein
LQSTGNPGQAILNFAVLNGLLSSNVVLAQRLEAAETANTAAMARSMVDALPEATHEPFAGGIAVFAGVHSPMTRAVGIGMAGPVQREELSRMEAFFRDRGSGCRVDLCPMADASAIAFFQARPYRVAEFNNVLVRSLDQNEPFEARSGVQAVQPEEIDDWSRIIIEALVGSDNLNEETVNLMTATCKSQQCWLAGEPGNQVGGAAMGVLGNVALFFGDAVRSSARRAGWHTVLIRTRLAAAQKQGCELAMAWVLPGSVSHRNYERLGFQLAYTGVSLTREFDEPRN